MSDKPTARPCIAPIQFFCHDNGRIRASSLTVEGGTVLLYEKHGNRYIITARHVWDDIIAISEENMGRQHGAFILPGQRFLPLKKDEITLCDDTLDVIVLRPAWLAELNELDFYRGEIASVTAGSMVRAWGYPGSQRTISGVNFSCPMTELSGEATAPCNGRFKFSANMPYHIGGFSGAPVFQANGDLVGLISAGSSPEMGSIVTCCELHSVIHKL